MNTDELRAIATMQFLAYEAAGTPVVWLEKDERDTYTGACARKKMLDPRFISGDLGDRLGYTEGFPQVIPLTDFVKKCPGFWCYGCYSEKDRLGDDLQPHTLIRCHPQEHTCPPTNKS